MDTFEMNFLFAKAQPMLFQDVTAKSSNTVAIIIVDFNRGITTPVLPGTELDAQTYPIIQSMT